MKIIYCHHANRKINKQKTENDSLSKIGKQDAKNLAKLLKIAKSVGVKISAIYTASESRFTQTAKLINKYLSAPIIEVNDLKEFNKKTETWLNAQKRVYNFLKEIIKKHNDDETVVCITSGVNVASFINLQLGHKPTEKMPFIEIPSCSPLIFNFDKNF